jgi:hypothetical protein
MSNQSTDQKMEDHPMDNPVILNKGKGKAADVAMEEDSSEEESGVEDHVSLGSCIATMPRRYSADVSISTSGRRCECSIRSFNMGMLF